MGSKALSITLQNGTLDGVAIIEPKNGDEFIMAAPRESAMELTKQKPECDYFGVYLLLSENCVYIGETTEYRSRIRTHLKEKKWWDRVVFLTTSNNKLNESDIKYIERILINKAADNKTLDKDNKKGGNRTSLRRDEMVFLDNYLGNILFLLEFINVSVFSSIKKSNVFYYRMEDKNIAILDKSTIGTFLREKGLEVGAFGRDYSYTGPRTEGLYFTIDPDKKLLSKDWTIVINDKKNYEIVIIMVPKIVLDKYGIDSFNKKAGKDNKISIRMNRKTLIDTSGFDFSEYVIKRYKYAE